MNPRRSPLLFACSAMAGALFVGGCALSVRQAKRQYALNQELMAALLNDDTRQAFTLVNAGADPNLPLVHEAAPPVLTLLWQRFHPIPPDTHVPTVFVAACGYGSERMEQGHLRKSRCPQDTSLLQTMLAHGANIHWRSLDQQTPLFITISANYPRAAQALLEHGADVNAADRNEDTPLIRAVARGETEMVRVLLAHGANVNAQNKQGETALGATLLGTRSRETIALLLVQDADPNHADKRGQTPISLAQKLKRPDIVVLLDKGAK